MNKFSNIGTILTILTISTIFSCDDPNQVLTFTNAIVFSSNPISEVAVDSTSVSCSYSLSFKEIRSSAITIVYARETISSNLNVTLSESIFQDNSLSTIFTDTTMLPGQEIILDRTTTFADPGIESVKITWLITGVDEVGNYENFVGDVRCE